MAPNWAIWNRARNLVGNFGDPSTLAFHNWIRGPYVGLQMLSIGETLYYITNQPNESTKRSIKNAY
jgi:hypothetical protein